MTINKLSYSEFIDKINAGELLCVRFSIKNYGHYNNCIIEYKEDSLFKIHMRLSNDKKEWYVFFKIKKKKKNMFKIVPKGRLTLKQIWNDVEIKEIVWA